MNILKTEFEKLQAALEIADLKIPIAGVKFYKKNEPVPDPVAAYHTGALSVTACQALRQAFLGDAVYLTLDNIGCIAAAITFGLVDQYYEAPLEGPRIYTSIMEEQTDNRNGFIPPSPADFTAGTVYACQEADRQEFGLFGKEDSGRFMNAEIARKAIKGMTAIQPPEMMGVYFMPLESEITDLIPDVVVMNVRPVELARLVQGYQFITGERVTGSMGAVRAVNSDLIVRPYLEQKINVSTYCVGARLIGQFGPEKMGMGMPFEVFKILVTGVQKSRTGYPFKSYPGADSRWDSL